MLTADDLTNEKSERVFSEIKWCSVTKCLSLSHCAIIQMPHIFDNSAIETITRLDLSHNFLSEISPRIEGLSCLKELWLSNNRPLRFLPVSMQSLSQLELIDIRYTSISEIPKEFANLTKLNEMDWRNTPLEKNLLDKHGIAVNDVHALKELLVAQYERSNLEKKLFEFLIGEHYLIDADKVRYKNVQYTVSACECMCACFFFLFISSALSKNFSLGTNSSQTPFRGGP